MSARVRLHYTDELAMPWQTTAELLDVPRTVVFDGIVETDERGARLADFCWAAFNRGSGREHEALNRLRIRSMCVGDVVEVVSPDRQFWLCKDFGFDPIEGITQSRAGD